MITKEQYEQYLSHLDEAKKLEELIAPVARVILSARSRSDVHEISFEREHFYANDRYRNTTYRLSVELLFDQNWQTKIAETLEAERLRIDRMIAQGEKESIERKEREERAELNALLKKYPDVFMNRVKELLPPSVAEK